MGVVRLFVVAFVVLTVIYVSISLYSRAVRREKLEREWDEEIREGDREAFVKEGLADYDGSLRRRLILAVYFIPVAIVGTIIYLVNY
jgi:Ca2+/Na+ antiporter